MTHRLVLGTWLIVTLAVSLLLQGAPARAQSVGISPGSIEVEDALRGSQYHRTFKIINQQEGELTFGVTLQGDTKSWIRVYDPGNPGAPISRIVVPPNSDKIVAVDITIPMNAANGLYVTEIGLGGAAPEGEPEGQGVLAGIRMDVSVSVTGTQRLEGLVSGVIVQDTEVGQPLRALLDFENTGNVVAEPAIQLAVVNDAGTLVGGVTEQEEPVSIEQKVSLKAEWDTSDQKEGQYRLGVIVRLEDNEVYAEPFDVRIWPEGTFTRQGELLSLELDNAPYPGAVAKLVATFRNTGEIDSLAAFQGEVYRGDVLVGTASSTELLVESGQLGQLEVFVEVPEKGKYQVEGLVNYEGKETESLAVSFKVPPDLGRGEFLGRPVWQWGIGSLLAIAVVGAAAVEARRRWRGQEQTEAGQGTGEN